MMGRLVTRVCRPKIISQVPQIPPSWIDFFRNSSMDTKLGFLNVGLRLQLPFFQQYTKRLKTGIFECCSRTDFPIFPNS